MKIETITAEVCRQLRADINPIVEKFIQDKYGLSGRLGNASYTDKKVTFKLEVTAEGVSDHDKQMADLYDWPPIGTQFTYAGKLFEVVSYAPKKKKPIVVKDTSPDGRQYVFMAEDVWKIVSAELLAKNKK